MKILEEAKIYGKSGKIPTKYQYAVNEAAGKLALEDPGLLASKGKVV